MLNCEVKFLSTLSAFQHQSDLQNYRSPFHLSVLQHLSTVLSHLFHITGIISKNSTVLLSIINAEVIHLKLQISKITGRIELFLMQYSHWNLRQWLQWMLPIYNRWNFKPNEMLGIAPSKLLFGYLRQLVFFCKLNEVASPRHSLLTKLLSLQKILVTLVRLIILSILKFQNMIRFQFCGIQTVFFPGKNLKNVS